MKRRYVNRFEFRRNLWRKIQFEGNLAIFVLLLPLTIAACAYMHLWIVAVLVSIVWCICLGILMWSDSNLYDLENVIEDDPYVYLDRMGYDKEIVRKVKEDGSVE